MCRSVQIQSYPLCQPQAEAEEEFHLFLSFVKIRGLSQGCFWAERKFSLLVFFLHLQNGEN